MDLARLEALESTEQVRAVIGRYCRACDGRDATELVKMFAEDAVLHNPAGEAAGKDDIFAYYTKAFAGEARFSRHHTMNTVITMLAPDTARHESYFVAFLGRGGHSKVIYGSYRDTLRRIDQQWVFVDKVNHVVLATSLADGWADAKWNVTDQ
jgi:uncharacterized protein (TIGR02246 family)